MDGLIFDMGMSVSEVEDMPLDKFIHYYSRAVRHRQRQKAQRDN